MGALKEALDDFGDVQHRGEAAAAELGDARELCRVRQDLAEGRTMRVNCGSSSMCRMVLR
jgi:hypothetical protein